MIHNEFGKDADERIPILLVGSKSNLIDKYDEMQICVRCKDVIKDMKQHHSYILGPIEYVALKVVKSLRRCLESLERRLFEGTWNQQP